MIVLDLIYWICDHWEEVTLNSVLLLLLRKFIMSEVHKLLFINRDEELHWIRIKLEGLTGEKWSGQQPIWKRVETRYIKSYYSYLRKISKRQRRMKMLTDIFKTSVSKKLTALILGAAVAALNKKFNLDLTPNELLGFLIIVGSYIIGQSHVDAKKVVAGIKDSPLLKMGFNDAKPTLHEIHLGINKLLDDVKKDDGSQAFKDAMQAYAQIKPILDALKHPEPLAVIVEDKVAS